jgi:hypothetical protein
MKRLVLSGFIAPHLERRLEFLVVGRIGVEDAQQHGEVVGGALVHEHSGLFYIPVAAPYNMQVSPLKRARQEGIAWAGLDGQGRGGGDLLTGDYLSRSMDFLFSKIQLNVALKSPIAGAADGQHRRVEVEM